MVSRTCLDGCESSRGKLNLSINICSASLIAFIWKARHNCSKYTERIEIMLHPFKLPLYIWAAQSRGKRTCYPLYPYITRLDSSRLSPFPQASRPSPSRNLLTLKCHRTDEECICRQNLPSAQACSLNIDAQLVVRCAGLLEIVKPISGGDYVEYLHRTAREFVESPPIWKKILGYTAETDFNADASLLRSYICQIGSHIGSQVESDIYTLQNIINLATVAMLHAYFADSATSNARADLLNHMDETMKELPVFTKYFPKKHWTAYTTWNAPASIDKMDSISFLTHAIQWDLAAYVEHTVTSSTIRPDLGPLIPYIAWSGITGRLREYNMSFNISPRTGSFLLQLCTKSNQKLEGIMVSPWKRVLLACYYQEVEMNEQSRKQHQTEVVSLLEQFVLGGASLQLQILPSDLDGRSPFRRPTKVLLYLLYIFQRSGFPVEVTENFIRQMTKLHGSKRARVKSLLGKLVSR